MDETDLQDFLSQNVVTGDVIAELIQAIAKRPNKRTTLQKATQNELRGLMLGEDIVVPYRKHKGCNSEAMQFARDFFQNNDLPLEIAELETKKDAKELIKFLMDAIKSQESKKHTIIVTRWTDIPPEHYPFLYENQYSIFVVNELKDLTPKKGIDYHKQGPLLKHATENLFKMFAYLSKPHIDTAGNNSGNQLKSENAKKRQDETYDALVGLFQRQCRKTEKVISQSELVKLAAEENLLNGAVNQSLVSRSFNSPDVAKNWSQLIKEMKLELKAKKFLKSANSKPPCEVIQYILKEAQNSDTRCVTYSSLYEFIFEKKWEGHGPTIKMNEILSQIHSFCIDAEIPIVNTVIGPTHGIVEDHIKQRMFEYYTENDGEEDFEDAEHFFQNFRKRCLVYDVYLLELLPEIDE